MRSLHEFLTLISLFATLAIGAANATVVHDESADGDLSGSFLAPDALAFGNGINTVIGDVGSVSGNTGSTVGTDADYFSFTIAAGSQLTAITIDNYVANPGPEQSFLGYVADSSFGGQGFGDIDEFWLFNASSPELLSSIGLGPLDPGTYAFWVQETNPGNFDYAISFDVTPIPLPAGAWLYLSGLGVVALWRRLTR